MGFLAGRPVPASPKDTRGFGFCRGHPWAAPGGPPCSHTQEAGGPGPREAGHAPSSLFLKTPHFGESWHLPRARLSPPLQATVPSGPDSCLPAPPCTSVTWGGSALAEQLHRHHRNTSACRFRTGPGVPRQHVLINGSGTNFLGLVLRSLQAALVKMVPASWQTRQGPEARGSNDVRQ